MPNNRELHRHKCSITPPLCQFLCAHAMGMHNWWEIEVLWEMNAGCHTYGSFWIFHSLRNRAYNCLLKQRTSFGKLSTTGLYSSRLWWLASWPGFCLQSSQHSIGHAVGGLPSKITTCHWQWVGRVTSSPLCTLGFGTTPRQRSSYGLSTKTVWQLCEWLLAWAVSPTIIS